mmetsp:Transcript_13670/g.22781  ORF Transcript_13670/g.22781 Transcript_13670/m.22781 type:complete len:248 (-) Transcript_13670:126-869(-)
MVVSMCPRACFWLVLVVAVVNSYVFNARSISRMPRLAASTTSQSIEVAPYNDIIPFLSEHIQMADQLLFLGSETDLSLQLAKAGYGAERTGFMTVVDSNSDRIQELEDIAKADSDLSKLLDSNRLSFKSVNLANMPEVCKQSVFDAIVDCGAIDSLINSGNRDDALKCIDHLQDAVRLGNILVCLSKLDKDTFCGPFDERFGWVQELDGDPGEISAWYRGKTNIAATKSNFQELGLKMYVYTNADNC